MELENRINLLYNYINSLDTTDDNNNYYIDPINLKKINRDDIEMLYGEDSKNIFKFILDNQLQFLFNINDDIYLKIISPSNSAIIKISLSNNSFNDNYISYILSEFVLLKKTTHILLPIINISINLLDIKNLLTKIDSPNEFNLLLDKNKKKIVNVKVREGLYNLTTLRKYLNEDKINYRNTLFRIIYTLLMIKTKYEYFQHNNLTLDNIFVYVHKNIKSELKIIKEYRINMQVFYLNNENYDIKITNFENSSIENNNTHNDLVLLASDFLKENKNIDLKSKNFLTKLRDMKNNNLENLLNDEYFTDLTTNKIKYKGSRKSQKINLSDNQSKIIRNLILEKPNEQQTGGGEQQTVLPNKTEKNTPFRTNDERNTFNKRQEDVNVVPKGPPVLLEQKVYDTSHKDKKPDIPPAYVPIYDNYQNPYTNPAGITNMFNPNYTNPKVPIQKVYNISLANPLHDFTTVSRIYEDILPGEPYSLSFTSTFERIQLINYMKNLINNVGDGEPMTVTGGTNSLLSSIKLLDLNPYSLNTNPLLDLPTNFLIYRAAYPIRYDETKNTIAISKSAHGINVRIYNISFGEMIGDEINQNITNYDFNLWRELNYYNYVNKEILGKKKSPNFVSSVLYKKDNLSNVHWDKLALLQKKKVDDFKKINNAARIINNASRIQNNNNNNSTPVDIDLYFIYDFKNPFEEFELLENTLGDYLHIKIHKINPYINRNIVLKFGIVKYPSIIFKYNSKHLPYDGKILTQDIILFINKYIYPLDKIFDLSITSGESLVLLTEAPHSNIIKWASPMYENHGSLKKMLATGYHKKEVWKSILFQLIFILYFLQKEEIYFEEFSLENNIYIKDLYFDPVNINYWIYKIDGFDYYVPNYGYLVLFDSKYSDIELNEFKIRSSKLFPNKNDKDKNRSDNDYNLDYTDKIYNKFKSIFDPAIFSTKLKSQGGFEPDETIIRFIREIYSNNLGKNIGKYIFEYFKDYLHNRIGTEILRSEKESFSVLSRPSFDKPGLLIKQERYDVYKWVLFINQNGDGTYKILNKDNIDNFIIEDINSYCLFNYSDIIYPNNITEKNIIETFNF
jgi:hypothetical protein